MHNSIRKWIISKSSEYSVSLKLFSPLDFLYVREDNASKEPELHFDITVYQELWKKVPDSKMLCTIEEI